MRDETAAFIETMGRHFEEEGVARIAGRLFGLLMATEEPCSLDDMAERLRISKGSASSNARFLDQIGLIERVTHPGDRRDYYQIAPEMHTRMLERQIERTDRLLGRLREGEQTLSHVSETVRDRFYNTIEFHENAQTLLTEALNQVRAGRRR